MITINEIAKLCDVSAMTVSRVINKKDSGKVSKKTRHQILEVAKKYNYRPNAGVKALRTGRTHIIGFITDVASNYFSWEVFSGVQEVLYPGGFDFLALQWSSALRNNKDRFLESIVDRRCEGLIVFPSNFQQDYHYLSTVVEHGTPVIVVDREIPEPNVSFVLSDDVSGAKVITEHLLNQGHKKVAFVASDNCKNLSTTKRRYEGYRDYLIKNELLPFDMFTIKKDTEGFSSDFDRLISFIKDKNITAVFANNDLIAADVITALNSADLRIPEDLSIAGFGDFPLSRYLSPQLTTVHQDPKSLGKKAAEVMLKKISHNRKNDVIKPIREMLPVSLVIRESVCCVKEENMALKK